MAAAPFSTLAAAFDAAAAQAGDLSCLVVPARAERGYLPDGLDWSYAETAERVERLAEAYAARGYGAGHRVALLLENRPEFMLHFLALIRLGACTVPVNPDYRAEDLAFLLAHSEADLAIALPDRCDGLAAVSAGVPDGAPVIPSDRFADALPQARRPAAGGAPDEDSPGALLYTSGTTGMPKGCLLSNAYFLFAGRRYLEAGGAMQVRPEAERLYNPLPLFYANSLGISNPAMILSRNAMIFPDRFHPRSWWQDLVQTRATIIHYLGIVAPVLLAAPPCDAERAHHVRFGVGAGLDPAQHDAFERRFGFPMIEVWGMSEVGIATAANHEPRGIDSRTIGRPLPGIELSVVDDADRPVADGGEGELLLRRAGAEPRKGLFAGYWKDEAVTAEAWRGGWFHTGDIVRRAPDGLYHFVDRKKHMIRRSGQNIAAAEVEACLRGHPAVAEVAVLAVPDELRDEEVLACLVPRAGHVPDAALAQEVVGHALGRLAYFKAPGWVLFLDELPLTATQKLRKSAIFAAGEDPRQRAGMYDCRAQKQRRAR
ncbi:AMP-binding protein [Marinibaculum pumilum]|uniref:AMP-binding protein n=1 Tax=Marinibaculum pumilum TaxID=1766165 RepID=A0ABV7L503_9PROT